MLFLYPICIGDLSAKVNADTGFTDQLAFCSQYVQGKAI